MPAQNDVLTPTDLAIAAYEKAREPKKLQILPGGHFDAYVDGFDRSGRPATGSCSTSEAAESYSQQHI